MTGSVLWLFHTVAQVGVQFVIVVFPDHSNLPVLSLALTISESQALFFVSSCVVSLRLCIA